MKIKARLDGSDGEVEYKAGDVLEGDSNHMRSLLINNAAEPLDDRSRQIQAEMQAMSEEDWQNHPLKNEPLWDRASEEATNVAERAAEQQNFRNGADADADVAVGEQANVRRAPRPIR